MNLLTSHPPPRTPLVTTAKQAGHMIAVVGGKGGVGKTNVATNLAIAAARLHARVLLIDGDLGLANVDVLLGLTPHHTAADILQGDCAFKDAVVTGPGGIHLIPAASARMDLASARPSELTRLLAPILAACHDYDLVVIDVGAGISAPVISLASVCDRAWLVTTPEPTSVTDAYATLKVLHRAAPALPIELLVNTARDELQALATHRQLEQVGERFLDLRIPLRGFLNRDARLEDAVLAQQAVVEAYPTSTVSRQLVDLASGLLKEIRSNVPNPSTGGAWRRITS